MFQSTRVFNFPNYHYEVPGRSTFADGVAVVRVASCVSALSCLHRRNPDPLRDPLTRVFRGTDELSFILFLFISIYFIFFLFLIAVGRFAATAAYQLFVIRNN